MGKSARGDNFDIRLRWRKLNALPPRFSVPSRERIKFCGRGGNGSTCSPSETLLPIPYRGFGVVFRGSKRFEKGKRRRRRGGDESAFCGASFMNSFYSGYLTADLQQSTGSLNKSYIVLYFEQVIQVVFVSYNIFI